MHSKFEKHLSTPPSKNDCFRSNNSKKITFDYEYSIHSLATLGELLVAKKKADETPDLRYLVDIEGEAWFARESHSNAPIAPAHYKMTGSPRNAAYCKTAGNLFFSDDYSTLIKLNNKSGDFRPSINSIKWILAILVFNESRLPFSLPEVLEIEEQGHNGKVLRTHYCPIADIKQWLETFKEDTELTQSLQKQNSGTKQASYSREGGSLFADAGKENRVPPNGKRSRKLLFEDAAPSDGVARNLGFEDAAPSDGVARNLGFGDAAPSDGVAKKLGFGDAAPSDGVARKLGFGDAAPSDGVARKLGFGDAAPSDGVTRKLGFGDATPSDGVARNLGFGDAAPSDGVARNLGFADEVPESSTSFELPQKARYGTLKNSPYPLFAPRRPALHQQELLAPRVPIEPDPTSPPRKKTKLSRVRVTSPIIFESSELDAEEPSPSSTPYISFKEYFS